MSVVFALGGEEAARHVVAAHREGVQGALRYVESHALSAPRGSGEQREIVPTTGLVAASFTHGVNRKLDPHLHTHVVMANMVHGFDSRWSACDHRGLSAHRAAASAVYESHLRAQLSIRLGLRFVEAPGLRAEVGGVSPFLLGEFSSRAADIRRHMAEQGAHSARGARVAWAATRPDKRAGLDFGELSERCCHSPPMVRLVAATWSPHSPPPRSMGRRSTGWNSWHNSGPRPCPSARKWVSPKTVAHCAA